MYLRLAFRCFDLGLCNVLFVCLWVWVYIFVNWYILYSDLYICFNWCLVCYSTWCNDLARWFYFCTLNGILKIRILYYHCCRVISRWSFGVFVFQDQYQVSQVHRLQRGDLNLRSICLEHSSHLNKKEKFLFAKLCGLETTTGRPLKPWKCSLCRLPPFLKISIIKHHDQEKGLLGRMAVAVKHSSKRDYSRDLRMRMPGNRSKRGIKLTRKG